MNARLNRLFAADGRCFDVAVDHGFFGEGSFLAGIEDMARTVATLVEAGPDAIQLSPGQAALLQSVPGPASRRWFCAPMSRTSTAALRPAASSARSLRRRSSALSFWTRPASSSISSSSRGEPELHEQCIRNVSALRAACDPVAMPLMVEPLAMKPGDRGYGVDGDVEKIVPLVRQAVELGADVIKADPTDDPEDYPRVVQAAGTRPVLVRGGGRVSDDEILRRTEAIMRQGAAGIVYGRNVVQHENPGAMTRALMAIVHDGVSAEEGGKRLRAGG